MNEQGVLNFFIPLNLITRVIKIDEEVDSLPHNIAYVEQQTGTNEHIKPAIPPVEGKARHPSRAHNKPSYLSEEYVVESH